MPNSLFDKEKSDIIYVALLSFIFLSLFTTSHILWSLSVLLFIGYALFYAIFYRITLSYHWFYLSFIVFYLYIVFSGIWAVGKQPYLRAIQMKSLLLGLPFCFMVFPIINEWKIKWLTNILWLMVAISALWTIGNYSLHRTTILENILKGQPIPVLYKEHIRYSVFLNFCLLLGLHQLNKYRQANRTKQFYYSFIAVLALFLYIQFLAVKIGIIISFIILLCFLSYKIVQKKQYGKGILAFIVLVLSLSILATTIPTISHKIAYFKWDLTKYNENNFQHYSDGERLVSIAAGWKIVQQHFWFGVGEGSIIQYLPRTSSENIKLPHNQFIVVWAQQGILGLLLFISIFVVGMLYSIPNRNWMAIAYILSMLAANMVEPMLETQLGLTIFTLPMLLLFAIKKS